MRGGFRPPVGVLDNRRTLAQTQCTRRRPERRFLLGHAKDRRQYLKRLWETSRRYPVSVPNHMVTSNHDHLLLWSESPRHVSAAMQYLSGATVQDYSRRLGHPGRTFAKSC